MGLTSLLGRVVSKAGARMIPGVGTAYALIQPTALANDADYLPRVKGVETMKQEDSYQSTVPLGPERPTGSYIPDIKTGASSNRTSQSLANQIGRGWDDVSTKGASSALKSLSGDIGMLGKARDAYLKAAENRKLAKENAITGNKELVNRYQSKDLGNLASGARKSIFNTNLALGAAGSGSAGLASARAIAQKAAVDRSNVLGEYGDEMSRQNQQQSLIEPEYQAERSKAYEWEDRNKRAMIENYQIQKKALDRLKSKVPDWKKEDLENENSNNLNGLLKGLSSIEAQARSFRDDLYSTYYSMNDEATGLETANLGIQSPAELQTPEFSSEVDMSGLEDGEYEAQDYYNPNLLKKKKTGKSIFDNPLMFEEQTQ